MTGYQRRPDLDFDYDGAPQDENSSPGHHRCPACPDGGLLLWEAESHTHWKKCDQCGLRWDTGSGEVWVKACESCITVKSIPVCSGNDACQLDFCPNHGAGEFDPAVQAAMAEQDKRNARRRMARRCIDTPRGRR